MHGSKKIGWQLLRSETGPVCTKVSHLQLGNCLFMAENLKSLHKGPQILGATSFNSLQPIQSGPVASEISEFVTILNTSKLEKSGSEIVICGRIGSGNIYFSWIYCGLGYKKVSKAEALVSGSVITVFTSSVGATWFAFDVPCKVQMLFQYNLGLFWDFQVYLRDLCRIKSMQF